MLVHTDISELTKPGVQYLVFVMSLMDFQLTPKFDECCVSSQGSTAIIKTIKLRQIMVICQAALGVPALITCTY